MRRFGRCSTGSIDDPWREAASGHARPTIAVDASGHVLPQSTARARASAGSACLSTMPWISSHALTMTVPTSANQTHI